MIVVHNWDCQESIWKNTNEWKCFFLLGPRKACRVQLSRQDYLHMTMSNMHGTRNYTFSLYWEKRTSWKVEKRWAYIITVLIHVSSLHIICYCLKALLFYPSLKFNLLHSLFRQKISWFLGAPIDNMQPFRNYWDIQN